MATADLDIVQLSAFCSVPQPSITNLLDAPTTDLVRTLLKNISTRAHELEEAKSQQIRLNVELENAVLGSESKSRVLKGNVTKAQNEATQLREKLKAEEQARISKEAELEAAKSSVTSSISEVTELKARISSLESSNRSTLSLLEAKATAYDQLAVELSTQHEKTLELRREVSHLEQRAQSADAASSSSKFHEQGLQQEIEQLKRSNDWLENELKTKSAEYSKYRKEKSARIAELQRYNDEAESKIDALNHSENTLRKRLAELNQKTEESFTRTQQLQEEASKKDEAFRIELDAANRLAELMKTSSDTEKARQKDLRDQLDNLQEDAHQEIGRISAELDTAHRIRLEAEEKVAELEVQIERLEADVQTWQSQASNHGSPRPAVNGNSVGTPIREGMVSRGYSPSITSIKGFSVTQMVNDYNVLKGELEAEKRRNEKLSSTIDDMIQHLEARQPELEELRIDHSRLESDVVELSALVDAIGKERDQAMNIAHKQEGQVEAKMKEGEILRQQLRDLSSQVKVLLMEAHLREKGLGELTVERHTQLERLAQGQIDGDESLDNATDTDQFISQNLVTFRNVAQLEEQNSNLLRVIREVAQRMEREEAARTAHNIEDLQQQLENCKDQIQSLLVQSQSYLRERDMFRRMLTHRGQLPPEGDLTAVFGQSAATQDLPSTPTRTNAANNIEQSPGSAKDLADYAKLLKDMQSHFDAYREEAASDRSMLKEQVNTLSKTNGELRSEVVRNSSQVTLAHERYEMLQANYAMLKSENDQLQKRSQIFSDSAAKQELRTQQVVEDLVEAKGFADSMRNENANLKAEKDFWKGIEKRLIEDNEHLSTERTRLNALNAGLQSRLNEREHADSENRRRLTAQVENLEKKLRTLEKSLTEEIEDNKRNTLRREYDQQQSQKKIDDLVQSLSVVREDLVAAKTTRDHLQVRIDEMQIELRTSEERLLLLQPPTKSSLTNAGELPPDPTDTEDSSLNREQELRLEITELRHDLELSRSEVESANTQIEQFKQISQSSEEQLQSMNETQDVFRQEMEKAIEERNSRIEELQTRIQALTSELSSANSELSELKAKDAENGKRLHEQKADFDRRLADLEDENARQAARVQYHQEDLTEQSKMTMQAQQNYENELVKHAEAAKALQQVREQLNEHKMRLVELKTEAESARTNLASNEQSWTEARERYERELEIIKSSKNELQNQNNRLHQQLENLSNQVSNLQKRPASDFDGFDAQTPTSDLDNLHEVIKYLRREKEIVDVQLELSVQEAKRLKQQLDYTQSQLDDSRLKLNQQRHQEEDSERAALQHKKLLETINELNTFRESSVTLRNDIRQAQTSLAAKVREIENLTAQIEPLQTEVAELRNERETHAAEMKLLQDNCDRWQLRAQNILQKYDRVDPAELEALKEKLKSLETEREELIASKQSLQDEVDTVPAKIAEAHEQGNERLEKVKGMLAEQFKGRSRNLTTVIKEKDAALQVVSKEKIDLEQRLQILRGELEEVKTQRDQAVEKIEMKQSNKVDSAEQVDLEDGQVEENGRSGPSIETIQSLQEKLQALEAKASENVAVAWQKRIAELESEITQIQEALNQAQTELSRHQEQQQQQPVPSNSALEQQIEQLRQDLKQSEEATRLAHEESATLRATASVDTSAANELGGESSKTFTDQVNDHVGAIRKELEARHDERVGQLDEQFKKRSEGMKNQLTKKLAEGKEQFRQSLTAEHEQVLSNLKSAHEEELLKLNARHQDELAELRHSEEERFASFKEIWLKEHPSANSSESSSSKAENSNSIKLLEPSEAEARELVAKNPTVRNIVVKNITTKVNQAKEALSAELKSEHEKLLNERLREAQEKANHAKEQAVLMEGKRLGVKSNIAENRARVMQAKFDIVEKAAQETPQKPVVDVWIIAKDAKPPPPISKTPQDTSKGQTTPRVSIFGQPTPLVPGPVNVEPNPQVTSPQTMQQVSSLGVLQQQPMQALATSPSQPQGTFASAPVFQHQPLVGGNQSSILQPMGPQGSLPLKPPPNTGNQQPNLMMGSRGFQQSGLPVARGGGARRSSHSRGRGGQGMGRGGIPQLIDTTRSQEQQQQQQQGRASPSSGGGARQFVPQGNKRARDDIQDGQHGDDDGNGKRFRGEGGGGA